MDKFTVKYLTLTLVQGVVVIKTYESLEEITATESLTILKDATIEIQQHSNSQTSTVELEGKILVAKTIEHLSVIDYTNLKCVSILRLYDIPPEKIVKTGFWPFKKIDNVLPGTYFQKKEIPLETRKFVLIAPVTMSISPASLTV